MISGYLTVIAVLQRIFEISVSFWSLLVHLSIYRKKRYESVKFALFIVTGFLINIIFQIVTMLQRIIENMKKIAGLSEHTIEYDKYQQIDHIVKSELFIRGGRNN